MVSFQCEACGDVFTKKKLDPHRGQCRGASFSCLDCMVHFQGTEYRSHTGAGTNGLWAKGSSVRLAHGWMLVPASARMAVLDDSCALHGFGPLMICECATVASRIRCYWAVLGRLLRPGWSSVFRQTCMSEAQKYQGALYKEKPPKGQKRKKTVTIAGNVAEKQPRNPYVEDASDVDDVRPGRDFPPPAPSPPPATSTTQGTSTRKEDKAVNVFEYLVPDGANASKVSLGGTREQMKMVSDAPKLFDAPKELARISDGREDDESIYDVAYEENGFSYGAGPIPPALYDQPSNVSMEFMTPGHRMRNRSRRDHPPSLELNRTNSEKKRKRTNPEHLVTPANQTKYVDDVAMMDAPSSMVVNAPTPALNHSGLTGGLSQLMRYSDSPDSLDYRSDHQAGEVYPHPVSPIKRTRRANKDQNGDNGLGISVKGRTGKLMEILGGGSGTTTVAGVSNDPTMKALLRTRRRTSPDAEKEQAIHTRKQKRHRVRQPDMVKPSKSKRKASGSPAANGDDADWDDYDDERPREIKAIEYNPNGDSETGASSKAGDPAAQLVVYKQGQNYSGELEPLKREKANLFLSLVNKGPDSERGCSIHKILKRFHRDQNLSVGSEEREPKDGRERGRGRRRNQGADKEKKDEEEQELWRMLRLRKNDRGEVVVFLQPDA
ncbi:predicted protein [Uncinocarpus reesii 1704]|uniref:Zinc finger C2H2 LYAR-type domain-containing protein n=1 Tax=Uncinocarpus reesii (strain UAMH 1704) TaxID=336963 RepID=C4JPF5_UNCRE|nr:uncharacterized protein UREG_04537 [Uncinocarpus reesii 1704]EEP79691.1 predicted protein [Uncinocarpus reesii 1704]